jgi:hypothetical protein
VNEPLFRGKWLGSERAVNWHLCSWAGKWGQENNMDFMLSIFLPISSCQRLPNNLLRSCGYRIPNRDRHAAAVCRAVIVGKQKTLIGRTAAPTACDAPHFFLI